MKVCLNDVPELELADRLTIVCSYLVPQPAICHEAYQSFGEGMIVIRRDEFQPQTFKGCELL
jgi:hypothetical protein